jgi:adenylate cyclase
LRAKAANEEINRDFEADVVNLAARLEGLNKQYDTQIIISEDVYVRVRHRFRCRFVDAVVAKGMTTETRVYELLAELSEGMDETH